MSQTIEENVSAPTSPLLAFLPWIAVPVGIIVLDQLLKVLMVMWIGPEADRHHVNVLGDAVGFEYVENTGAAFGIMTSATGALAAVSLVIAAGGVLMLWREHRRDPVATLAIALVVGGALGNVIDRIYRGYVVDFVAIGAFPRFNLADSAITIGVLLLLVAMIRDNREQNRTTQEGTDTTDG